MLYDIVVWLNYVTGDYDYRITFCSYNSFSVEIKLFQFNSTEQIREEFGLVELFWLLLRLGLLPQTVSSSVHDLLPQTEEQVQVGRQ